MSWRNKPTKGTHAERDDRPSGAGWAMLDVLIGLIMLALLYMGVQWVWQYWGSGLDVITSTHRIEQAAGWESAKTAADDGKTPRIAESKTGEPPAEARPAHGGMIGYLRIPRLGADWSALIQEGTDQAILDRMGVGHYESSPMPGQLGATAYAGHRNPPSLWDLDHVKAGDAVVVETRDHWYVYKVTHMQLVGATDVQVLEPEEGRRTLVLTTCDPKYATANGRYNRLVAFADFQYWADKADGTVAELLTNDTEAKPNAAAVIADVGERVSRVTKDMPVTPFLALVGLGSWLVLDLGAWLVWRERSWQRMLRKGWWCRANPMVVLWRIQAGPLFLRIPLCLLMWMGLVFACFAWTCPWFAETFPLFAAPHPTV